MGIFDPDDKPEELEIKYWRLMSEALKKGLCLVLQKHKRNNVEVLFVQIYNDNEIFNGVEPWNNLFFEYAIPCETRLYYKAEKFIKEYME
jgi:hypothetical protein